MKNTILRVLCVGEQQTEFEQVCGMLEKAQEGPIQLERTPRMDLRLESDSQRGAEANLGEAVPGYDVILAWAGAGERPWPALADLATANGLSAPVILLASQPDEETRLAALEAGASLCLDKDQLTPALLERSIRAVAAQSHRHNEESKTLQRIMLKVEELEASKAQNSALFNNMSEGFLVGELIYNSAGQAVDFRPSMMNPVLERHSGLRPEDVNGKTARQVQQEIPDVLLEIFDRVVRTGQPEHYEVFLPDSDRYYEGYAYRAGPGQFALLFHDITGRRKTEQERMAYEARISESEARFRSVLDHSVDVVYRRDLREDRYDYMSPAAEQMLGFTPEEMNEMPITEVMERVHPEDRAAIDEGLARAMQTGQVQLEYRFRHKDGRYRWLADYVSVEKDAGGQPLYRSGIMRDITGQKETEAAIRENQAHLRKSEEDFRVLADHIPQLAWMADASGSFFWFNQRWFDYTGTSMEEMRGWGWQKVIHPQHVRYVVEKIRQHFDSGEEWEDIFPMRGKEADDYRWFLSRMVPIRGPDGQVLRWFGTNTDITEQREREAALLESEAALMENETMLRENQVALRENQAALMKNEEALLENETALRAALARMEHFIHSNMIGIVTADQHGRIFEANDYFLNLLGFTRDEFEAGQINWTTLTPPEHLPTDEQAIAMLQEAGVCAPYEKEYFRKDGSRVWVLLGDSLLENGQIMAFVLDISDRKKTEEELQRYADRLAASNQDLQNFAFIASHDLQEPLRKIISFGEMLRHGLGGALDEHNADLLARMQNAAARMQEMILGLLSLSRVSTHAVPFTKVDLNVTAAEVVSDLEGQMIRSRGSVQVDPLPSIEADPLQMRQLLQNLIGNGLKFHRPDVPPRVRIYAEASSARDMLTLVVEDNGIGFETEYLPRILEPFQRLHGRSQFEGSGMGLAICRRIVERHGGEIRAESQPGQGTKFFILLPVKRRAAEDLGG